MPPTLRIDNELVGLQTEPLTPVDTSEVDELKTRILSAGGSLGSLSSPGPPRR